MDTKELILEVSLELFSEKGFNVASVRDIAKKIGIKDSSLYFHYKNKQAILDSLMGRFINISDQMMSLLDNDIMSITSMNDEQFYMVTEQYIQSYFMNDFINKFIMVMNHERSHNEKMREQYIYWCVKKPIEYQMTIIEQLQKIGYLKKLDAHHITVEYYAPIFLYFNQYMNHGCTNEDKAAFKNAVMTATRNFIATYKKEI